jgi:hypothetical protein
MKKLSLLFLAIVVAGLLVPSVRAATPAQIETWKKEFPAATPGDSANLHRLIASYETMVKQVTATTTKKLLPLMRSKLIREQQVAAARLHPTTRGALPPTDVERAEMEAELAWLNTKFAPFLSQAPP